MSSNKSETPFDVLIVRLGGEIGIKSAWTRRIYEKRLIQNIKATLKHHKIPYDVVTRQQGRIYIKTNQSEEAAQELIRVFGISSLSPAIKTKSKLEDITAQSLKLARQKLGKGKSFAVRCKRVGTHPYTSRDVCQEIGRQILNAFSELQPKVDLDNPDVTIGIEIREDRAYVFADTIPGVDGLPLGTQPRIIGLIKANLNSPVACWLTMKRGCPLVPVHFKQNENDTIKKVKNIAEILYEWSAGYPRKLYMVPHSQNLATLNENCPPHLVDIINKRLITRIAAHIAEKEKAEALVMGETIGEKPHQTLRYFKILDQATRDYPIHRPLVGLTDAEIERLAQKIGIPKTQTKKHKVTEPEAALPTLEEVEAVENKLNIQKMIDATVEQIEKITI